MGEFVDKFLLKKKQDNAMIEQVKGVKQGRKQVQKI